MSESASRGRPALLRVADRPAEQTFGHPLNPKAEMRGVSLSEAVGLRRVGLHLVRIPPGKEANIYHSHTCEEEFFFILAGRGIAEIDGVEHEVAAGDFMGFATPSVPHQLRNPHDEELVYLVGGERREFEVAEYPRLGKRIIRVGGKAQLIDSDKLESFWQDDD